MLAEVETAEKLGISLRRLRGWTPTVRHVHDAAGRLVASTPDAEWDELEAAWMVALRLYRAGRCRGCGGDLTITTAAENEEQFKPELPLQCFRCVAFAHSHEAYRESPHPHTLIHLVPTTPKR